MSKLTLKQRLFVAEYLIDLNATQAAIRAGYSPKTAYAIGEQNIRKPSIQAALKNAMKNREKRTEVTADKVVTELAKIAFANGTNFARIVTGTRKKKVWNEDLEDYDEIDVDEQFVQFVDTDTLSDDEKAVISAVKETRHGIAVESYDKVRALELLGKHLGMFKDKIELSGELITNPFKGLTEAELRRLAGEW